MMNFLGSSKNLTKFDRIFKIDNDHNEIYAKVNNDHSSIKNNYQKKLNLQMYFVNLELSIWNFQKHVYIDGIGNGR